MLRYVGKRLVLLLPVLLGVTFIIFAIMEMTPGDPAVRILGAEASAEQIEALREEMGLNRGFLERFVSYVYNVVVRFDFGVSWRTQKPVFEEILPRFPVTITLALWCMVVSTLIGVPMGVFSAIKQNTLADNSMRVLSTVMVALPPFWLGMLLILLFSLKLGWLPASGAKDWTGYILPVIAVAGPQGCRILRITRSTMLECIREDYVRSAKAKGVPKRKVTYSHALKNALLPVITTVGTSFGASLAGAVMAECVFSMPGMGSLLLLSIRSKDTPMLLASVLLQATLMAIIMLLVDLVYALVDPRIKAKYKKS